MRKLAAGLYYGDRLMTEVLVDPDEVMTNGQVIELALEAFERNPTIGLAPGEAPYERRMRLQRSTVRWFR